MIKTHTEQATYTKTITDATVCDLCKKEFPGNEWTITDDGSYDDTQTVVSYRRYHSKPTYPEVIHEKINIDICPDCFKNRLIPWLKSQGADVRVTGDLL